MDKSGAASGPSVREKEPEWKLLPDVQAWWWHWNGEDLAVPHIYFVMVSHSGPDRYFIAFPDSRWCDALGGFWCKLEYPNMPTRERQKQLKETSSAPPKTEASK
jgi:hypothetical protein